MNQTDGVRRRAAFHTLGCKVNMYETESMREDFLRAGFDIVSENEWADVYIINTCTVTAVADRKSRQFIRRMKQKNPDAVVCVTGCYVQTQPDEVAKIEDVDIIAGTNEKENIIKYVTEFLEERDGGRSIHVLDYSELSEYHGSGLITSMESRTRAFIKIEEGCDRFCAYCVIPYARGPVRSRPMDEIVREARYLVDNGFTELILTGINTALYEDLEGLLERLEEMDGDFRVRLSSLEPTVINKDYVKKLFRFSRLCHHLHLSVQSGSDNVLAAMKRRYDMKEYMDIVSELKAFDPLYGISTDIIAGFPGETEEDHQDSLNAIGEAGFVRTHAFGYSRRPGTVAADMKDQIPAPVKKQRVKELIAAGEEAARKFNEANIGTRAVVIFEEHASADSMQEQNGSVDAPVDNGTAAGAGAGTATGIAGGTDAGIVAGTDAGESTKLMVGYTGNYIHAYAPFDEALLGKLTEVEVTGLYADGVMCRVL